MRRQTVLAPAIPSVRGLAAPRTYLPDAAFLTSTRLRLTPLVCRLRCADLAMKILQYLPPAISIAQHESVAAVLGGDLESARAAAAHTLACMGPQAVAEHYEEIMGIVDAGHHPRTSYSPTSAGLVCGG